VKETVSDEAREDQWGVRSFHRQDAAYRKERLVIFKRGPD